jgi:hypothetical protein
VEEHRDILPRQDRLRATRTPMNRAWKILLLVIVALILALCFGPGLSG